MAVALVKHTWQSLIAYHLQKSARPLITIIGPTASGKTGLSLECSLHLHDAFGRQAEVINADSRQIYRWMEIGTAAITEDEMRGIPHHLFGILRPDEEITAGRYQSLARTVIDAIHKRGNIPVLVGGSMLYVSSIIDGLSFGPVSDPEVRKRLVGEFLEHDGASLYSRLQQLDPETAATIDRKNAPRLVRAVEICETSGKKKSDLFARGQLGTGSSDSGYDSLILGVFPPRETLFRRINNRVETMIGNGWIEEVQSLMRSGYTEDDPGMKAAGYREILKYLKTGKPELHALIDDIASKTRRYAKRQISWWNGDMRIHRF